MDAIRTVVERAEKASKQKRFCAVITIDVKNAFNSWEAITEALHRMRVPDNLRKIWRSYLQNRDLVYETEVGSRSIKISAGVPQGSILEPTLWNAMYNGVLTLKLPKGVEIVGFANDVVLTVTGETMKEVEMLATVAINMIGYWMQGAKLQLAHHKTELLAISNCKAVQRVEITVGEHVIVSKRVLKYLGVMIDDRLNFNGHVEMPVRKQCSLLTL